ncbi:MAG: HEAT repeat protein [Myxococcota bacterium]|jgi:HEAT repeat protein
MTQTCEPHFDAAGLSHRQAMLERERTLYPEMVRRLGGVGRGRAPSTLVAPTSETLRSALDQADPAVAAAAAFLMGRSRCATPTDDFVPDLTRVADGDGDGAVRAEAAMSLALLGQQAQSQRVLTALAASSNPFDEGYSAAAYLTQFGDPSGYPTIVSIAGHDLGHYRLMALRRAPLFKPWSGTSVGDVTVDPAGLLRAAATDSSEIVRREVPLLLQAVGVDAAEREVLEQLTKDDSEDVRRLAQHVLESL